MQKQKFKKSYGDFNCTGYSKEYMDCYTKWRKTLSKKQLSLIENRNEIFTSPSEFRRKNKQMRKRLKQQLQSQK